MTRAAPLPGHGDGAARLAQIHALLGEVMDPEIPVLSIVDLGIVRSVTLRAGRPEIALAPTYTGCPATEVIEASVRARLRAGGFDQITLRRELSPPWSTDAISAAGRSKLAACGIVPPAQGAASKRELMGERGAVACPRCASCETEKLSEFGSTPCKAAFRCLSCLEPFEYFKCI